MDNRLKKFYSDSKQDMKLSSDAQQRVKDRVFANLGAANDAVVPVSVWKKLGALLLRSYVLAPLVVLLFVAGTGIASADAVPGDPLYSVKRKIESARVFITPTEDAKLELKMDFAEKRLNELEQVDSEEITEGTTEEKTEQGNSGEVRQNYVNPEKAKARQEADHALEALKEVQKKFEEKGKEKQVEKIDQKLEQFQIRLNNRNSR